MRIAIGLLLTPVQFLARASAVRSALLDEDGGALLSDDGGRLLLD